MNEGLNLHRSAFSLAAISLHFCNTFSWFGWQERYFILFHLFFLCNMTVHHKPLLERANCELQHVKKKWVDLGTFGLENGIASTFTF